MQNNPVSRPSEKNRELLIKAAARVPVRKFLGSEDADFTPAWQPDLVDALEDQRVALRIAKSRR
jgi:hypothetical protein